MVRQYSHNGLAGCVQQRRARQNGALVGIYHAEQARLDPEAGDWATVCEDHGIIVNHRSLRAAKDHAADPCGWCEDCREGVET